MITIHEDAEFFREAVRFTAEQTGFGIRLIEKDYFCTVVLEYLIQSDAALVFKGGTSLAKIHAQFYRLSEDLDFIIPVPLTSSRTQRRTLAADAKRALDNLEATLPTFRVVDKLEGRNEAKQYIAAASYKSIVDGHEEIIKIEIGLREPLCQPLHRGQAATLLLDPRSGLPMVSPFDCPCLSYLEQYAEKYRAALSRREPAIRDFFDLDYAARYLKLDENGVDLIALVRLKINVSGNDPINVTSERFEQLGEQVQKELAAVLRLKELEEFDLDRALALIVRMEQLIR